MIKEQLPLAVDYQTPYTRLEVQGNAESCTTFGGTSAIEVILHRLAKYWQLSTRFVWYNMRGGNIGVEGMAAAIEREGVCLDEYCPYVVEPSWPYNVIGIYDTPSSTAWKDAKTRLPKGVKPVRIAGKEAAMRALAQGSALTAVKVLSGGLEHCVAIIGYNSFGVKVHDSGMNIYYQPWADLEGGGSITQLYRWEGLELVPHPDYIEGTIPTLANGVVILPKVMVYVGFPEPSLHLEDVRLRLLDNSVITSDNAEIKEYILWHNQLSTLTLPKLNKDGKILYNVKIVMPATTFQQIQITEIPNNMIKGLMIGDSVLYGACGVGTGPHGSGRLNSHPQQVLNAQQSVFDFCYNYSMPGASFSGILSSSPQLREANGMPSGCTIKQLLANTDAVGVLISMGGNDNSLDLALHTAFIANIKYVADACVAAGKLFAFVGLVDVHIQESIENMGLTGDMTPYLRELTRLAANAETIRQVCVLNGYAYVDIRNNIVTASKSITGDIVHPNQAYSEEIFTYVAKAITGAL
jgi:hypothetical protein